MKAGIALGIDPDSDRAAAAKKQAERLVSLLCAGQAYVLNVSASKRITYPF